MLILFAIVVYCLLSSIELQQESNDYHAEVRHREAMEMEEKKLKALATKRNTRKAKRTRTAYKNNGECYREVIEIEE